MKNSKTLYERMYAYLKKRDGWVARDTVSMEAFRAGFTEAQITDAHKALYDAPDVCYRYNKSTRRWEYRWYAMSEEELEGRRRNIAFFDED